MQQSNNRSYYAVIVTISGWLLSAQPTQNMTHYQHGIHPVFSLIMLHCKHQMHVELGKTKADWKDKSGLLQCVWIAEMTANGATVAYG